MDPNEKPNEDKAKYQKPTIADLGTPDGELSELDLNGVTGGNDPDSFSNVEGTIGSNAW